MINIDLHWSLDWFKNLPKSELRHKSSCLLLNGFSATSSLLSDTKLKYCWLWGSNENGGGRQTGRISFVSSLLVSSGVNHGGSSMLSLSWAPSMSSYGMPVNHGCLKMSSFDPSLSSGFFTNNFLIKSLKYSVWPIRALLGKVTSLLMMLCSCFPFFVWKNGVKPKTSS